VSVVVVDAPSGPVRVSRSAPVTFVAATRTSLESGDPEGDALKDYKAAVQTGTDELWAEHTSAWAELWESGIEITGRMDVARVVNSSQYYLLSSLRADAPYSTSPGGLAHGTTHRGYLGHTFWDAETWMYPSLVLWHPDIAASMLEYRLNTVPQAEKKAASYNKGWKGAMFAWESAATGAETCPSQYPEGELEQHITGDIALAAQQLWYATHNKSWLEHAAEGLVMKTADFWVSRVEWDGAAANINNVIPPDESADGGVDNSVFTNFVAKRNLYFAEEAAQVLAKTPDPQWRKTAEAIVMNFNQGEGIHPEFQGYGGGQIKQADVVLLGFPLTMNMTLKDRRRDLEYYAPRTDPEAPCMSWSMYVTAYLEVGDMEGAERNFEHSFANSHPPFQVWTENPDHGTMGFLTGLGGFLQTMLFGFGGLRIWKDHLDVNPSLISDITNIVIRGVKYRGSELTISFDQDNMEILCVKSAEVVHVTDSQGTTKSITKGNSVKLPRSKAKIRVSRRKLTLNEFRLLSV
jgi:trehalose/maltose hydrolase-like predicted phosphorylase